MTVRDREANYSCKSTTWWMVPECRRDADDSNAQTTRSAARLHLVPCAYRRVRWLMHDLADLSDAMPRRPMASCPVCLNQSSSHMLGHCPLSTLPELRLAQRPCHVGVTWKPEVVAASPPGVVPRSMRWSLAQSSVIDFGSLPSKAISWMRVKSGNSFSRFFALSTTATSLEVIVP